MGWLGRLLLGTGALSEELKTALAAEGLVVLEEGLSGSVRYRRFRAPGKRFHGKVTAERLGLGISERRVVVYCRSGRVRLIDTEFGDPRMAMLEALLEANDKVDLRIDYDHPSAPPEIAGQVTVRARTARAPEIVAELERRMYH